MVRFVIEIYRDDRPPWQAVKTYAHLRDSDFSELVTAERFAAYIRLALRELELEAEHPVCFTTDSRTWKSLT
jgi:hypothetical protein